MKKLKDLTERIRVSCGKNRETIIDATVQAQRFFSGVVVFVFLFYFCLISMTDYVLWQAWNKCHLYDLLIAGVAAVNWFVFSKSRIPREKVLIAGDVFILVMLILLAAGRSLGGNYVSYTLAVCTTVTTTMLSLNPLRYSVLALIAMLCEIVMNHHFLGGGFVTLLYYGVDAFLIFEVTTCLNWLFSLLRHRIFDETSALQRESTVDALTGLYNRKYFEHHFWFHHKAEELSALIHIDLDNFKTVNDTLGHQAGDALLKQVAETLRRTFRQEDCVARVGGDEFMVFMPALPESRCAYDGIQRLLEEFPIRVSGEGVTIPVSLSVGVVFSRENEFPSYSALYEQADEAMYQAKKSGKGKAVFLHAADGEPAVLENVKASC